MRNGHNYDHYDDYKHDKEIYNEEYDMEMGLYPYYMPHMPMPCMLMYEMEKMPYMPYMHMPYMSHMPEMYYDDYEEKHEMGDYEECAGIEEYYKDKHEKECEDYENYMDIMDKEYPELSDEAKNILKELMALDFTILELSLYLDTHPMDQRALIQHNRYVRMRYPLVRKLKELYGPLTHFTQADYPWAWLNQPWPWRIEF